MVPYPAMQYFVPDKGHNKETGSSLYGLAAVYEEFTKTVHNTVIQAPGNIYLGRFEVNDDS